MSFDVGISHSYGVDKINDVDVRLELQFYQRELQAIEDVLPCESPYFLKHEQFARRSQSDVVILVHFVDRHAASQEVTNQLVLYSLDLAFL